MSTSFRSFNQNCFNYETLSSLFSYQSTLSVDSDNNCFVCFQSFLTAEAVLVIALGGGGGPPPPRERTEERG
jgi:hypothetical protein